MKPWERYSQQPAQQPAQQPEQSGPWSRYATAPMGEPAAQTEPEVAPTTGAVDLSPLQRPEPLRAVEPKPSGAQALVAGVARGGRDLIDSGAYLLPKGLEAVTSGFGLVPNPVSQFFGDEASRVSGMNEATEKAYQQQYGDSGWATGGRIAGNIGTAFIPGTGQANLANRASNLWRAGGALNKLRSVGVGAGLGAAQGVALGTQTEDKSITGNALLGALGGGGGQAVAGGIADGVNAVRRISAGAPYREGERLLRSAVDPDAALANITNARQLVPGSVPMAHQVADDAGISRAAKAVRNYVPGIAAREAQQDAARRAAVEGIAPITGAPIEAATDAGNLISQRAMENRGVLRDAVSGAYNQPILQGTFLTPPSAELQQVGRQFFPRVPTGTPNEQAVHAMVDRLGEGVPISFPEFQQFRSLASNRARDLADSDRTASAAYSTITRILDDVPERTALAGNLQPEAVQAFDDARFLRRTMGERFDTGPAAGIFRTGSDGLPQRQGAEVTRSFFNSGATQRQDIDALSQMLPGDDEVLDAVRKFAITDLDAFATKGASGEYSASKFNNWMRGRAEALPGVMSPDQVQTLTNVGDDLSRAERAVALGAARGGSDTAMNQVLSAGVLDSPFLTGLIDQVVRRVPVVGNTTANLARGAQQGLADSARRRAAEELAQLIMDPQRAAQAMQSFRNVTASTVAPSTRLPLTITPALAGLLSAPLRIEVNGVAQ